jgi:hypothetical protein
VSRASGLPHIAAMTQRDSNLTLSEGSLRGFEVTDRNTGFDSLRSAKDDVRNRRN